MKVYYNNSVQLIPSVILYYTYNKGHLEESDKENILK
jgi:hypothetical protein